MGRVPEKTRPATKRAPSARANKRAGKAKSGHRATPSQRATSAAKSASTAEGQRYWSHHVMETSDALDLEDGVFRQSDPARIAQSLSRSAERSNRRKAGPFQSAMSMLNFYVNRAGRNLPAENKRTLEQAKDELRKLYGRPPHRG